jgi:hypothetical protein
MAGRAPLAIVTLIAMSDRIEHAQVQGPAVLLSRPHLCTGCSIHRWLEEHDYA